MKRFAIFAVCFILVITATFYFVFRSTVESKQTQESNDSYPVQDEKITTLLSARNVSQKPRTESASVRPDAKASTTDQPMPIAKPIPPEMSHAQQQSAAPDLNPHVQIS